MTKINITSKEREKTTRKAHTMKVIILSKKKTRSKSTD